MSDETKTLTLRIHGRVQGVWYRGWTVKQAQALGVSGWVRNRPDGTVEALVHGPAGPVDDMVRRCHEGPPAARVDRVDQALAEDVPDDGFEQR